MAAALRYQTPTPIQSSNYPQIPSFSPRTLKSGLSISLPKRNLRSVRSELASFDLSSDDRGGGGGGQIHIARSSSHSLMAASTAVSSMASLLPKRRKKSVCLFYCEEMRELAERVAMESDAIELRSITWR